MPPVKKKSFYIISLGCPKNLVDAEVMAALLIRGGYRLVKSPGAAAVIIVNTCAFILPAKEEAIETILTAAAYKQTAACRLLVVTGCLPQRYGSELVAALPEVDLFLGTAETPHIAAHLDRLETGAGPAAAIAPDKPAFLMTAAHSRLLMTPPHTAYLKIGEGCSNRCSYCIIPDLRGPARSRPPADILAEARKLVGQGVKELIIIAQDTTAYGGDLPGRPTLPRLLQELAALEGLVWLRLLYSHPARITPELVRCLAREEKICSYLDMPVQHIDDEILQAMNRRGDSRLIRETIRMVREEGPDIALRTSLIVGFPGETKRKFDGLVDFIREARFDHLGVFTYSPEEGTAAAPLSSRISAKEKRRRQELLLEEQTAVSAAILARQIGTVLEVLIEEKSDRTDYPFIGRNRRQAPEIDGVTFVRGKGLRPGRLVPVRIRGADTYDLYGEVIDN